MRPSRLAHPCPDDERGIRRPSSRGRPAPAPEEAGLRPTPDGWRRDSRRSGSQRSLVPTHAKTAEALDLGLDKPPPALVRGPTPQGSDALKHLLRAESGGPSQLNDRQTIGQSFAPIIDAC